MRIKRLEISGFKSFVEKATFDFPEGITAVVGPNGCGKSNVVDAIRWVMGEQSAKNLRGRQMEDVIFGGSETRKSLGMAEVSLIFSVEDRKVPVKFLNYSEIQVTRRLYRDGESEYLLNRTPCRLMDISELFMDTGVGARAYSIIEQGRIGMILMAKPEERRFLIEEAAGVTKYKSRKQVALKKIDVTRQNLLRIGDIVGEVRRQLNSLHRQAKKAERFRAVREELRGIELHFASQRFAELSGLVEKLNADLELLEQKSLSLASEAVVKENLLEDMRLELLETEKQFTAVQEDIFKERGDLQATESRLEYQRREAASFEAQSGRLREELVLLQAQIAEAEGERRQLDQQLLEFTEGSAGGKEVLEGKEQELEVLAAAERGATLTLEESRKRFFSVMGEISQAANQYTLAGKRLDILAEKTQKSIQEERSLKGVLTQAEEKVTHFQQKGAELRARNDQLSVTILNLAATINDEKGRLDGVGLDLQKSRDELSAVASRLHSLQELEAQFAGYGQGVRALMLNDGFKNRFLGLLADIVEVDEAYEPVLEAVLGNRLQSLLVANEADIYEAVHHLKEGGSGRCGFILSVADSRKGPPPPEGSVPLLSCVSFPDAAKGVMNDLLNRVMLAADLESAIKLARAHPDFRFVTMHGDMAYGGRMVVGGAREQIQQGLIHKKREIRGLAARKISAEEKVAALVASREELLQRLAAAEKELQLLKQEQRTTELQLLTAEKDLQRSGEEVARINERILLKKFDDEQLAEERELLQQEMADAKLRKETAESLKLSMEQDIARLQSELEAQRTVIDAARAEVTAMKVQIASLQEKREATQAAIRRALQHCQSLVERSERQETQLRSTTDSFERFKNEAAATETLLTAMIKGYAVKEERLAIVKNAFDTALSMLKEQELLLKELKNEEESLRRQVAETGFRHSGMMLELNNLEKQLREKFRMDAASVAGYAPEPAGNEAEMLQRQAELHKQVEEFGEVNLTAIEEYQELEERHTFLAAQKADLEESLNSLQQAIQRINRTTRKRFAETFELVNEKFQEVFPRLFCGGKAELRLTNEEDLLETGLDIVVQPPGKKLQNVSLLSGGEKALTAVALIFSIFLIKPSPFCLLDEVDAPLDDANIGRFNEMIREMSAFSQFILITHSKTTMAVADTLYGVTMEEPGVSKLVSVKLQ